MLTNACVMLGWLESQNNQEINKLASEQENWGVTVVSVHVTDVTR